MGTTASRHHIENGTTHNIYVRYDGFDVLKTGENMGVKASRGKDPSGEVNYGWQGQAVPRPTGFNMLGPGDTHEHVCDTGALLSVIVVKDGIGYLVINNQKLEEDRSYKIEGGDGSNAKKRLYKKKYNSDEFDKFTCAWSFDQPIEIYDWQDGGR